MKKLREKNITSDYQKEYTTIKLLKTIISIPLGLIIGIFIGLVLLIVMPLFVIRCLISDIWSEYESNNDYY